MSANTKMNTRRPAIVDFYRGGMPENKSGKVVRIDFKSGDQVKDFSAALSTLAEARGRPVELSEVLDVIYRPTVRSFRLTVVPSQIRTHHVKVDGEESGSVTVEWTATKDGFEDSASLLQGLVEHSGGHHYLTHGSDGAEIVAAHYQ